MGALPNNRKILRRVHILPSLLTLGNFSCGFFSIVLCLNALFFTTRAQMMEAGHRSPERAAAAVNGEYPDLTDLTGPPPPADLHVRTSVTGSNARAAYMLTWACIIVFIGMLFDMLDGKIARHMGADSAFGKELDSLSDIVTFGIAPPLIVTTQWIAVMPIEASWWGQVMIFGVVYAACAALRLARYNVDSGIGDKNIFSGLPSPAAAGCVVTAVLLAEGNYAFVGEVCGWLSSLSGGFVPATQVKSRLLAIFLLFVGTMMVTTIPFVHLANRYLVGRKPFAILVVFVFLLALLWHEPRIISFLMFNGYLVVGLVAAARKHIRDRRSVVDNGHARDTDDSE